jgi:hypothetical protein
VLAGLHQKPQPHSASNRSGCGLITRNRPDTSRNHVAGGVAPVRRGPAQKLTIPPRLRCYNLKLCYCSVMGSLPPRQRPHSHERAMPTPEASLFDIVRNYDDPGARAGVRPQQPLAGACSNACPRAAAPARLTPVIASPPPYATPVAASVARPRTRDNQALSSAKRQATAQYAPTNANPVA